MYETQERIFDMVCDMLKDIDVGKLNRIEININEGVADVDIEMNEDIDEISISEMLDLDNDAITLKTMATSLLMTDFRNSMANFIKAVDETLLFGDKWVSVINMILDDVLKNAKKNYSIKVISE